MVHIQNCSRSKAEQSIYFDIFFFVTVSLYSVFPLSLTWFADGFEYAYDLSVYLFCCFFSFVPTSSVPFLLWFPISFKRRFAYVCEMRFNCSVALFWWTTDCDCTYNGGQIYKWKHKARNNSACNALSMTCAHSFHHCDQL